jgi:hypothetical protein
MEATEYSLTNVIHKHWLRETPPCRLIQRTVHNISTDSLRYCSLFSSYLSLDLQKRPFYVSFPNHNFRVYFMFPTYPSLIIILAPNNSRLNSKRICYILSADRSSPCLLGNFFYINAMRTSRTILYKHFVNTEHKNDWKRRH